MAALARTIVWLRPASGGGRISGERRSTRAGRLRPTGGRHCLAIRRASDGRGRASDGWWSYGPAVTRGPAGQRRPTGGPDAAGSARQSSMAVRRQRTRRDRGMDRRDRGTDR